MQSRTASAPVRGSRHGRRDPGDFPQRHFVRHLRVAECHPTRACPVRGSSCQLRVEPPRTCPGRGGPSALPWRPVLMSRTRGMSPAWSLSPNPCPALTVTKYQMDPHWGRCPTRLTRTGRGDTGPARATGPSRPTPSLSAGDAALTPLRGGAARLPLPSPAPPPPTSVSCRGPRNGVGLTGAEGDR